MALFGNLRLNAPRESVLDYPSGPHRPPPVTSSKTLGTTVTRVESWSEDAKPLKKHTWLSYLYMAGDVVLVLLPLYFIFLGVATAMLHSKPTKGNALGPKVEFAMGLGPTIFPIVFAAICGRSMKMIARYLAEKGTKLSNLELLMASQSVWGTIESQLLMQQLTLVGVNLLFLWALSPLGGQASLRLMSRRQQATETSATLRYMSTGPGSTAWGMATTYQANGKFADAAALYSAALMVPTSSKLGPQDPWGNVKIPSLEAYNVSTSDQWLDLPATVESPEAYSSLVGLPIVGLPLDANSSFTVEISYLVVDCGALTKTACPTNFSGVGAMSNPDWVKPEQLPGQFWSLDWAKLEELVPGQVWSPKSIRDPFQNHATSFFIDTDRPNYEGPIRGGVRDPGDGVYLSRLDAYFGNKNASLLSRANETVREPRGLLYASMFPPGGGEVDSGYMGLNVARCSLSQNHAEAVIGCDKSSCAAKRIRKSLSDTRPAAYTGLEHGVMMFGFAQNFPLAIACSGSSSATERFLANSSQALFLQHNGYPIAEDAYTDLSLVSPKMFSQRLSLLMNTYYQVSTQPVGYFGSLSGNLSLYGPDSLPATDVDGYVPKNLSPSDHTFEEWWDPFTYSMLNITSPFVGATTVANVTSFDEIFVCNFAWLALLLTSSAIIFVTGIVALILKRKTLGPELFGFVASMTYENPHMRIPKGGSALDAMERARLLKDVEVFVGDVHSERDVGHIAFAAGAPHRKLERGRLYA